MKSPVRVWVRRLTSTVIVCGLLALGAVAVNRARERQRPILEMNPERLGNGEDLTEGEEAVGVSQGVEVSETVAGKLVFALNSIQTLGLSSGVQKIEGVRLQLYNDSGEPSAVLNCDGANFNVQTRDARLSGSIHVELPGRGFFTTERGNFEAVARRFTTDAKVVFAGEGVYGQAGKAIYTLAEEKLVLREGVIVRMAEGQTLTTPQLRYERATRRIVFPGGCRIEDGGSFIEAPAALVMLDERDGSPLRIRFLGGVEFGSVDGLTAGELEGWCEHLLAERDDGGTWHMTATTSGPWVRLLMRGGKDYMERAINTYVLHAVLGNQGLSNIRADQVVCMRDIPFVGSPRWAEARSAQIWFRKRMPSDMELQDEVVLTDDAVTASGARARFSVASRLVTLYGDASGRRRVMLASGSGQVTSDQLQLHETDGRAQASGNVQGHLEHATLLGAGATTGLEAGPMHFAGSSLDSSDNGNTFHLKGVARAWQQQRYLFADELILRQDQQSLQAFGHVRATLPAAEVDPAVSPDDDSEVMVSARSLEYSRDSQEAVFRSNVRYSDTKHILTANELRILFDQDNTITSVEATGMVDILDLVGGRRMKGQKARRDSASQTVQLTGSPVVLSFENGNQVQAASLTWDQASGSVSIAGGPDGQTETIFYPEDQH